MAYVILSHFLSCVFDVMMFTVPFSLIEIRTNTQMHTTSHHTLKSLNLQLEMDRFCLAGTHKLPHTAFFEHSRSVYYINKDQMMQVRERACI